MRKISRREAIRGSGRMFHIEPQMTARKRRIQTLVSHQLSSLFHGEQKQISCKLLSINFHTNACLSTLKLLSNQLWSLFNSEQGELKQLSYKLLSLNSPKYICFITSKVSRNNSHTNYCLSTLIQTFVSKFSHKLLSINSHTNSSVSILIHTLAYQLPSYKNLSISTLTQTLVCQLSSLFHHEQGESKQLSYTLLSTYSHTSENSLILVATTRV